VLVQFKKAMEELEELLATFLLDKSHWQETPENFVKLGVASGKTSMFNTIGNDKYKVQQQPMLSLWRTIYNSHAVNVMETVNRIATRVYSDVEGNPGAIKIVAEDGVFQHVPSIFEGKTSTDDVPFYDLPSEQRDEVRDAAKAIKEGYRPGGPKDDFFGVTSAEENNEINYGNYLRAKGINKQRIFHHIVGQALCEVDGIEWRPGHHKGQIRFIMKSLEYGREGVPRPSARAMKDTVRGTVVCRDHASLVAAHAALLEADFLTARTTKDRREDPSCRDVLQVVSLGRHEAALLCEVQFHFASVLPLKAFSHAAYNVRRLKCDELYDLQASMDQVFDFNPLQMDQKTRRDIKCKLQFQSSDGGESRPKPGDYEWDHVPLQVSSESESIGDYDAWDSDSD
jgi:hypothetical protein